MQNQAQQSTRVRLRIKSLEIVLKAASKYPINLKLLSDGRLLCNTKAIDKDQALRWEDLNPIDGNMSGSIEIRVYELHWHGKKRERIGSISLQVPEIVRSQSGITAHGVPSSGLSSISMALESVGESRIRAQAAQEVATKVVDMSPKILDSMRQTQGAVNTILNVSQNIPEVESVVEVCKKAREIMNERVYCDALVTRLVIEVGDVLQHVGAIENHAKIAKLRDTIKELLRLVEDASRFVIEYKSDGAAGTMGICDEPKAYIHQIFRRSSNSSRICVSSAQDQVDKFTDRFRSLKKDFSFGMTTQVTQRVEKLLDDADRALLEKLIVSGASYDLSRCCLDGTRIEILKAIRDWALITTSSAPLFWLYGPAGCGKSSIATSISDSLQEANALAGSFFCKRDNEHLRKPENVISHLAVSLAFKCPLYGEKLLEVLRKDPTLAHSPTRTRFVGLMVEPLAAFSARSSFDNVVLVVDAIDESGSAENRTELVECLLELSRLVKWLKVLVTSRPNQEIRVLLDSAKEHIEQRNLFAVDEASVSRDIKAYIQSRMNAIAIDAADRGQWPDDQDIDRLRAASNKLFIWARTACNLIQQSFDPEITLKQILGGQRSSDEKKALGLIYTTALNEGLGATRNDTKIVQLCVGAIVLTASRRPLPDSALAMMLSKHIKPSVLSRVINRLGSVLYRDDQSAVRVLHQSFSDYMAEADCPEHYRIDPNALNAELTTSCLEVMLRGLKFNICNLEDSCVMNRDVVDLQTRIETNICPELMYSCAYWITHLVVSPFTVAAEGTKLLEGLLDELLNGPHLLYWIEVLSLTNDLRAITEGMALMIEWSDISNIPKYAKLASEVYRFVFAAWEVISANTPHLYVSAFPFGAVNYAVFEALKSHFPNTLSVTNGMNLWNTRCLRTISAQGAINSTSVSPDGHCIAAGTEDGTVQIWDVRTGEVVCGPLRDPAPCLFEDLQQDPPTGLVYSVTSVAFSPADNHRIAFGSTDWTVRIWDIQAPYNVSLKRLRGHYGIVTSVTFSSDGRRIISGSADKTVRVWDAGADNTLLHTLRGHTRLVTSVACSPNGRWVISGSRDNTVRIWETQASYSHSEPLEGHSDYVMCVAFSSDSQRIISGSRDKTVLVWDVNTRRSLLRPLREHSKTVTSAAFSLDGRLLISGSEDKTVRIWDARTGTKISDPFQEHEDSITSVSCNTFDGRLIISSSRDRTIRVWDIRVDTGSMLDNQLCIKGHSDAVTAVAFSSDGRRIASGSRDTTIRIWDAYTGAALTDLIHCPADSEITFIAFTSNDQHVVCGSEDFDEQVWACDLQTGGWTLNSPLGRHPSWATDIAFHLVRLDHYSHNLRHLVPGFKSQALHHGIDTGPALAVVDHAFPHELYINMLPPEKQGQTTIYKLTNSLAMYQDEGVVSRAAFSSNRMFLATAGNNVPATLWMKVDDYGSDMCFRYSPRYPWAEISLTAASVAFSPDSRSLLLGRPDYELPDQTKPCGISL
ncbi:hypothetical protein FRC09_000037 [Ceratobasidium sp. 395]|nr:hypothetical protein FRC09_000037 [Ceratobasidium sp. 395]